MTLGTFAYGVLFCTIASPGLALQGQTSNPTAAPRSVPVASATPRLPIPSGPFGIGRMGYDWTDTSRPDRFSADPRARRELMVYLWYPTSKVHAGIRGTYLPGAKQMDASADIQRRMRDDYEANWPLIVSGAIYSHVAENAPVAKSPKQFPLIIFSHGMGGSCFGYTSLLEDLVSHGYVVAAIEHTQSASAVLFPDGRIVPFHDDSPPPGLSPAERWQRMMASVSVGVNEGAADVRFVLDRLTALNDGDAQHFPLAERLDMGRVAAMGHSAGAEFAARACQLDARFKACVDLDGGMVPVAALPEYPDGATMKQPLLFLEAYHPESKMGGTPEQHKEYFKKQEAQLQLCPPGTYAVVLRSPGIVHASFSDFSLLAAGGRENETGMALHNLALVQEFIRAFLGKTLHGRSAPILDSASARPSEADVQPYGH